MQTFPIFNALTEDGQYSLAMKHVEVGGVFYPLQAALAAPIWMTTDKTGTHKVAVSLSDFMVAIMLDWDDPVVQLGGLLRVDIDLSSARFVSSAAAGELGAIQAHSSGPTLTVGTVSREGHLEKHLMNVSTGRLVSHSGRGIEFPRWSLYLDEGGRSKLIMSVDKT